MNEAHAIERADMTVRHAGAAVRAAEGLSFAAAPTFAIMALLTIALGGASPMLCLASPDASALTGMARLGVAPIVLGHVANHRTTTRAGVTLAVYSQYVYDKEKRAALAAWASHIENVVSGVRPVNVVSLRKA